MKSQVIEVEANSLEEARAQAKAQIPEGLHLLSEEVLEDGEPEAVTAVADSASDAFKQAESQLPAGVEVTDRQEIRPAATRVVITAAENEARARWRFEGQSVSPSRLLEVRLVTAGKKGFLGIGRTLSQFEADVFDPAEVSITYQTKARMRCTYGDRMSSWSELLDVVRQTDDPMSAQSLLPQYPHQIMFALISGKLEDPDYFEAVPFDPITDEMVGRARRYIDSPPVPGLLAMFGTTLSPNRYKATSGEDIGRESNPAIDACIVTVATCLKHHGTVSSDDPHTVCRYAYEAIQHYGSIPVVRYFFALPYLEGVIHSKEISPTEAWISVYKGTEGLLLEIYEDLGEGEVITDRLVTDKVSSLMR